MRPLSLEYLDERVGPKIRLVLLEPLVVHHDGRLGAVPNRLSRGFVEPVPEQERHRAATQFPGQLPRFAEKLQRDARDAAVDELYHAPAVVRMARLLPKPLRLLPRRAWPGPLRDQRVSPPCGFGRVLQELPRPLRRDVVDGEDAGRRAGLPEALVARAGI